MSPFDITAILQKEAEQGKKTVRYILIAGSLFIIIGALSYFTAGSERTKQFGLALSVVGSLAMVLYPIVSYGNKAQLEEAQLLNEILTLKPQNLVWGYIYELSGKGGTVVQVHLGISGKPTTIFFNRDNLPDKDEKAFLLMLKNKYNPDIVLGFSEEMQYKLFNKLI